VTDDKEPQDQQENAEHFKTYNNSRQQLKSVPPTHRLPASATGGRLFILVNSSVPGAATFQQKNPKIACCDSTTRESHKKNSLLLL
jgi:hypothetical protein